MSITLKDIVTFSWGPQPCSIVKQINWGGSFPDTSSTLKKATTQASNKILQAKSIPQTLIYSSCTVGKCFTIGCQYLIVVQSTQFNYLSLRDKVPSNSEILVVVVFLKIIGFMPQYNALETRGHGLLSNI